MKAFIVFTLIVAASALPRSVVRPIPVDDNSVSPGALRNFNLIPNPEVYPQVEEISDDNILELLLSRIAEDDDSDDESDVEEEKISLNDLLNLLELIHNIHNNQGNNEEVSPANEGQNEEQPGLVPDHENQNAVSEHPPQSDSDDENVNDQDQQINNEEPSDEQNNESASGDNENEIQNENGDSEQPTVIANGEASNDEGDVSVVDIIDQNPAIVENIAKLISQNVQGASGNQRFVNLMRKPLRLDPHSISEDIQLRPPNLAH